MAVQPRSSAAVMLLRDAPAHGGLEVFMLQRVTQSAFMPDVYVFPGGSVQAGDAEMELQDGLYWPELPDQADPEGRTARGLGVRAAALRELFEEAGVLLAYRGQEMLALTADGRSRLAEQRRALHEQRSSLGEIARAEGLHLAWDSLHYFAHWITPEALPRRFTTHFFLATAPTEQEAVADYLETSEGRWIAPSEALRLTQQEQFPLVFATIHQLRELAAFTSVAQALQVAASRAVQTREPRMIERDGQPYVYLPDQATETWAVPDSLTIVRPNPPDTRG